MAEFIIKLLIWAVLVTGIYSQIVAEGYLYRFAKIILNSIIGN